jgi:hypothetical protein
MNHIRDRGSTLIVATLIAMIIYAFPSANVATASPTDDSTNLTAISAVDLTNDNIADAIVATPTANGFDGQASTDATRATLDNYDMTRPTASPPKAISMNESAYDCDIGTAASTTLSTDDMNRATYCNSGVHRLLTRIDGTPTRTHGSVLTT